MIHVRPEVPSDHEAIHELHLKVSGSIDKAELVKAVRSEARPPISMVARIDDVLAGHIIASPVRIESDKDKAPALLLGPMAVPEEQRGKGVEAKLVEAAMAEARLAGHRVVFLVGEEAEYGPLGFQKAAPKGLRSEFAQLNEAFMVAELEPGALAGRSGVVRYPSRSDVM